MNDRVVQNKKKSLMLKTSSGQIVWFNLLIVTGYRFSS